MPQTNLQPHLYGMRGTLSAQLAAERLDRAARAIASPVTTRRGLAARLNYLTRHRGGHQALRDAGVTVTPRTLRNWQRGTTSPSPANRQRIDDAYLRLRRKNLAPTLARRLNNDGRGTRVELYPHDQTAVDAPRRRGNVTGHRTVNCRHWEHIAAAWADQDPTALKDAWQDAVLEEVGSDWGAYEYSTAVGFPL